MDQPVLDLERCSFLRPLTSGTELGTEPSVLLRCWAGGQPREIDPKEQGQRCFTVAHSTCPALKAALNAHAPDAWTTIGCAARVVSEACNLAEAQLEVRAAQLSPALARIFGGDS
jgi:hypothetical protein